VKHVILAVALVGGVAWAEGIPRVVVQPLAATIPLPGAANSALLTTLAGMAIELPSTFEVEDALAALPSKTCAEDEPCLAGLARATKSRWAMAVAFHQVDQLGVLSAKVVSADGVLTRSVEKFELATIPANEEGWAEAFRTFIARLSLESLGTDAPPVVAAAPVAPPEPQPAPVISVPVVTAAPTPSARVPVAVVAGLVAVGAGAAAGTLALINLREASALEQAKRGGLIPQQSVDRAVAIDERTVAATALGIGAGVAAGVAAGALLMKDAPVQLAPSVSAAGPGLTLSGRLP
jgi:hypothetical protein